jgi:hypothetical protein
MAKVIPVCGASVQAGKIPLQFLLMAQRRQLSNIIFVQRWPSLRAGALLPRSDAQSLHHLEIFDLLIKRCIDKKELKKKHAVLEVDDPRCVIAAEISDFSRIKPHLE